MTNRTPLTGKVRPGLPQPANNDNYEMQTNVTPGNKVRPHFTGQGPSSRQNDLAELFKCPVCSDYTLPPIMQCHNGHIVCSTCQSKLIHCPTCRGSLGPNSGQNDLAALFECPVCFDYALPPIMQCQSGHIVCSTCRPKLTLCPTCRGPLGNIRNLAMEKVASSVSFPCKYSSTGCSVTLPHTEKPDHEEACEYRPYSCPCPGASCKWQGSLDQVMPHLMAQHKSITTLQGEDIVFLATDINLPGAVDWVMMQSCFDHNFMLVLEKQERYEGQQLFYAVVQLIGTKKQAENFAYRLELNGHRRRLTWEATPRSIHDGVQAAINKSDCLMFDTNIAQLFADNGNLGINVTINMCQQ